MGFFEKISAGLKKTRDSLMGRLEDLAARSLPRWTRTSLTSWKKHSSWAMWAPM